MHSSLDWVIPIPGWLAEQWTIWSARTPAPRWRALIACILAHRYDPPYFSHALGGIQPFGLVEAV